MRSPIGAWLVVWTGLWVIATGCYAGPAAPGIRSRSVAPVVEPGPSLVVAAELLCVGRRFAAGYQRLLAVRERRCRGRRSRSCDQLDRQLAELAAIVEQVRGRLWVAPGWPESSPEGGGGREVMVIVPVVE